MSLHIRPFEPRDQDAVRRLILAGLGEHFGWIDETRNPDLDDIETNYLKRDYIFIVAEIDGKIVGTGALLTESQNVGRIVRMSVSKAHRRNGIGRALVTHLLSIARQKSFSQVRVATTPGWQDAIRFYRRCGFNEYERDDQAIQFVITLEYDTQ